MNTTIQTSSTIGRNVDAEEQAHYSNLADQWWQVDGPFWPLHALNNLRKDFIRDRICKHWQRNPLSTLPCTGVRVLDVGCGGGILSESMARMGAQVHGIDVVERNLAVARVHAAQFGLKIDYDLSDAATLVNLDHQYDVVLNMEVVEHVPDAGSFISDCARLVAPGGVMFIATINRNLLSFLTAIVGAEYVLRWLPRGTHQWRRFLQPEELLEYLGTSKMRELCRVGVQINPINRKFSLREKTPVNYMLMAEKPAATSNRFAEGRTDLTG